jgi:hypothetical protein
MTLAELVSNYLGRYCTSVIDVGARWGMERSWYRIHPLAKLLGFDPDEAECRKLNSSCPKGYRYVPLALHKYTGEATLYKTLEPACSSFYEPDQELAELSPGLQWYSEDRFRDGFGGEAGRVG